MENYKVMMVFIEFYHHDVCVSVYANWNVIIKCVASTQRWNSHIPGPEFEVREVFITMGSVDNQVIEIEGFAFDARKKPTSS